MLFGRRAAPPRAVRPLVATGRTARRPGRRGPASPVTAPPCAIGQVEVGAAVLPGRLPARQPGPLAQLVADRLARDAEVADQLAVEERGSAAGVLAEERPRELRRPRLARGARPASPRRRRDRQPQVHADVDDHPHRAHLLRVEEAQPLARVGEVAQLVHQPLGVERPALDVGADRAERRLVGREVASAT